MRYVAVSMAVGCLIWLGAIITQYMNDKEDLGELRLVNRLQEESIRTHRQEAERTDTVLRRREEQRGVQDVAWQKAVRQLYEAKEKRHDTEGQYGLDSPLPDDIVVPLRLQYQAIAAGNPSCESTASKGSVVRATPSRTP